MNSTRFQPLVKTTIKHLSATSSSCSSKALYSTPSRINSAPKTKSESSTSAADYKLSHQRKIPPLPVIDPPSWSVSEAVNNILYNTPPPSNQPYTRHVLNVLVQNETGVLARVSSVLAARGFNIDSLVVCATEVSDLSRMCIVLRGQDNVIEQARRQLEDLVPVWAVLDYTRTKTIERELLLAKISILGPEYFADQLMNKAGILSATEGVEDGSPVKAHLDGTMLAASAGHPGIIPESAHHTIPHLTPSEALRQKHTHLASIRLLAEMFHGKIVDMSNDAVIVEMAGKTSRVDAFLKLVRPYGILEAARSGAMVMPRAPITSDWVGLADEQVEEEAEAVDSSLLPPG